jgi:hypothetical protein
MKRNETSRDEMQLHVFEAGEQRAQVVRGEHLQMRGVVLGLTSEQEAKPVFQAVGVRNGGNERAARSQDA